MCDVEVLVCNPYSWCINEFVSLQTVFNVQKCRLFYSLLSKRKKPADEYNLELQSSLNDGKY